jgi:glutamate-1-semialdehyde 2,1-aminomutase
MLLTLARVGWRLPRTHHSWRARSLTPALSRRLSRWVKSIDYAGDDFFRADGAGERWVQLRKQAWGRLARTLRERSKQSAEWAASLREGFSDLRFADANRVPFPFSRRMREAFELCTVVTASEGPRLLDLDGRWSLDVGGSYGVNVAGYDVYKAFIARAWERVQGLGPVLGPLHPIVADNIARLREISGLDEVSFHTSGTEAVMAAVRLARFNTRRKLVVCFSGAYHGWWDGVQPGIGNERVLDDCLPLKEMHPSSLEVIRRRAGEIAAVLVNPVQCFHPNSPPPNDAVLLTSEVRRTQGSSAAYRRWLQQLRAVCTERDVPLIFDEVYSGFRIAPGGAQAYFGVNADMVLYGKTVAGGLPVGVVCGRKRLMQRFDPARPMRIAYVIGTFSAHPLVMAAMNEFLRWVTSDGAAERYQTANARCREWAVATNRALENEGLPIEIAHLGTVWTVQFREPARYNWLLQYYLRAHGLTLSWVGTGRCLVSLDFTPADFEALTRALLEAAREMKRDGWWLSEQDLPGRNWKLRARLAGELLASFVRVPARWVAFHAEVMQRKRDDHAASHHDRRNQALHLVSSSVFLVSYALLPSHLTVAMCIGLPALFVRQVGHAVFEPPCHDEEKLLLGFTTRSKTLVVAGYLSIPILETLFAAPPRSFSALAPVVAFDWFLMTLGVVLGHVVYLVWKHDLWSSMIWLVKLVTDPLTDLVAYAPNFRPRS